MFQFFPSIMTFGLLWFLGGLLLKACAIQNYFKFHAGDSVSKISESNLESNKTTAKHTALSFLKAEIRRK